MLKQVNLLYLGCRVLILLDRQYMGRFWTQFEAWLAMRRCTPDGLRDGRFLNELMRNGLWEVVVMYMDRDPVARTKLKETLEAQWLECSLEVACLKLAAPDVEVTNQSDKIEQLEKLANLSTVVKQEFPSARRGSSASTKPL